MIKYIKNIIIILLLLFFVVSIINNSNDVMYSINFSFVIWKNSIFPCLFPFFVLSDLLIHYGFVDFSSKMLSPIMNKLFKINKNVAFIFIMSMISGFPSSARYTRELYNKKLINDMEATKALIFTHFSNPLFILGTISISFIKNKKIGLFILIIHYLTNIIIGILFRNCYVDKLNNELQANNIVKTNNNKFSQILTNSIINSINSLLVIFGTISFFLVITTIIDKTIHINAYYQSIINGILEMTQGIKYVSILNISLKLKATLITMLLSFGGISVHMQVISFITDTKIKYLPFLTARILHSAISGILVFILFDYWLYII
ncbi:MAG: hypothetical protein PHN42_04070 [Bacilli bacterium]|nr:hypothetical protein [Bacilli bacterium]